MIDDTSDFFDLDDFAETVKLNGKTVKAIFDTPRVQFDTGYAITVGNRPQLTCRTTDVESAKVVQGSAVIVRKKEYTVQDIDDDGTGIAVLHLHETQ